MSTKEMTLGILVSAILTAITIVLSNTVSFFAERIHSSFMGLFTFQVLIITYSARLLFRLKKQEREEHKQTEEAPTS